MSDIRFNCPECAGHLVVNAEGAGRQLSCPHCGKHLTVPEPTPPPPLIQPTNVVIEPPKKSSLGGLHIKKSSDPNDMGYADDKPHGSDVNVTQPIMKKKDQWFTEDNKHYHYCYYDPHSPIMETACGSKKKMPVSANIAPLNLDQLKKGALCSKCMKVLES